MHLKANFLLHFRHSSKKQGFTRSDRAITSTQRRVNSLQLNLSDISNKKKENFTTWKLSFYYFSSPKEHSLSYLNSESLSKIYPAVFFFVSCGYISLLRLIPSWNTEGNFSFISALIRPLPTWFVGIHLFTGIRISAFSLSRPRVKSRTLATFTPHIVLWEKTWNWGITLLLTKNEKSLESSWRELFARNIFAEISGNYWRFSDDLLTKIIDNFGKKGRLKTENS